MSRPSQEAEPSHQAELIQAFGQITISDGARGIVGHVDNVTMFEAGTMNVNHFYSSYNNDTASSIIASLLHLNYHTPLLII